MEEQTAQHTEHSFPRRRAATGGFRRGQPRSAAVFGGTSDWRVRYLCSSGPTDPVLALHELDSAGRQRQLADPRALLADDEDLPAAERARRERLRESGAGITAFSSDRQGRRSVFALSGRLWLVDGERAPQLQDAPGHAVDPRISPDGSRIAYHADGALHLWDVAAQTAAVLCGPEHPDQAWGLAEFIAAEEMDRLRGFWWAPGSDCLLVTSNDEAGVATWWISDPADPAAPPRSIRYPAAGTANAEVRLWLVGLDGSRSEVAWDRSAYPYLAAVQVEEAGTLCSVQSRDQRRLLHLAIDPATGSTQPLEEQQRQPWVELVPGSPRIAPDGDLVQVAVDQETDSWRLRKGQQWLTPPDTYVRSLLRCGPDGIWIAGASDPREQHLLRIGAGGVERLTDTPGWHAVLAAGPVPVVALADERCWQPRIVVGDPRAPSAELPDRADSPAGPPRVIHLEPVGPVRVAVVLPPGSGPAPVIVSSYGGPHAQRVVRAALPFTAEQWLADQGFAVVVIDGRGSPGVAPSCEAAIAGDLAGPPLADQVTGLRLAAAAFPDRLDQQRVGIRGWSFGGYLSALAVLEEPGVFHAAFAGAPVTEWRNYDTHYTERYLGMPQEAVEAYDHSSLLPRAPGLCRPLCLVHGMADDNVVAAHTLQLSAALTAAGRPHEVLPLPGISHMTPQESVTENLLRLELAFFDRTLRGATMPPIAR